MIVVGAFALELEAADSATGGFHALASVVFSASAFLAEGLRALVFKGSTEAGGPRHTLRSTSFHRVAFAFFTVAPGGNTFPAPWNQP